MSPRDTPAVSQAESIALAILATAVSTPTRSGFDGPPDPSATSSPAPFISAIFVFVPPPSTPKNSWYNGRLFPGFVSDRGILRLYKLKKIHLYCSPNLTYNQS